MKVTYHAAKRFLERVKHQVKYTHKEMLEAKLYLEEMFTSVIPGSYARPFPLPEYKGFKVVHRDNTVITIVPKKRRK